MVGLCWWGGSSVALQHSLAPRLSDPRRAPACRSSPFFIFAPTGQTAKFMGIRNGIDPDLWSPTENKFLPMPYDAETALEGKRR